MNTDILLLPDFVDLLSPTLPQPQQSLLSSEDIQRIENISLLYKKRIELGEYFDYSLLFSFHSVYILAARDELPWDPSMHTVTFLETLNSRSVSIMRLLSFFKQIPEFNQLNVDDKVTLVKHNLLIVVGINSTLLHNKETGEIVETDTDIPWNTQFSQTLYGYNIFRQVKKIIGSFLEIAKYDESIIQLILIIVILTNSFSTNDGYESILNDGMAVYRAQNYYTELLWKYMETMYGLDKTIQLFSQIVIRIVSWQTIQDEVRNNLVRVLSPEDINELLPIIKSVFRIS
jgi:hypothetical protein